MSGKTHFAIGVAAGVGLAVYGFKHGRPDLVIGAAASPFGAMLPDMDHNATKLGRVRKATISTAKVLMILGCIALGIFMFAFSGYEAFGKTGSIIACSVAGVFIILSLANKTERGRKALGFYQKHRGIMHTLIPVILLYFLAIYVSTVALFSSIILGLALGYTTHLLSDTITTEGCPLLFPLSKSCISILGLKVGSKTCYFAAFLMGGIFVWLGWTI